MTTSIVHIAEDRGVGGRRGEAGTVAAATVALPAAVVAAAVLVQLWPQAQAALQFDRHAVEAGQVWRVLTCHLAHWSWPHLAADLTAFAALCWLGREIRYRCYDGCHALTRLRGWACSRPSLRFGREHGTRRFSLDRVPDRRYRGFAMVAASFAAVGVAVWAFAGDIAIYRGLSGVNYALLGWLLAAQAGKPGRLMRLGCLGLLAAVAVKIAFEVAGASLVPGIGLPEGIAVVGVAHAAGLTVGALTALRVL